MMTRSSMPAWAALVAKPARIEWPEKPWASSPAAAARRCTISLTMRTRISLPAEVGIEDATGIVIRQARRSFGLGDPVLAGEAQNAPSGQRADHNFRNLPCVAKRLTSSMPKIRPVAPEQRSANEEASTFFSPEARVAAAEARRRRAALKAEKKDALEVFIVMGADPGIYRWQIRQFGALVLKEADEVFNSVEAA